MKKDIFDMLFVIGIALIVFGVGIFLGLSSSPSEIKSKEIITPELNISVINGIADTTYVYKSIKVKD